MLFDLKFAFRQLAKSPGFAFAAILSLALGIGANTGVFSVVKSVMLQTLPVRDPAQLAIFYWEAEQNVGPQQSRGQSQRTAEGRRSNTSFSVPTFEAFRDRTTRLGGVAAFSSVTGLNVVVDGEAEIVPEGQVASGNYHAMLGIAPAAGRLLVTSDDAPTAEPVVVISHRYWQRRFGGDAAAVGKTISVNGVLATIVGVTAEGFKGLTQVGEAVDITAPLAHAARLARRNEDMRRANFWWVRVVGRLKPDATLEQARADLEGVFRETARGTVRVRAQGGQPAAEPTEAQMPRLGLEPGATGLYESRRDFQQPLLILACVVGLVLLIACANVANLLLARGATRRREIAVRLALGATRAQIVRQLLGESVLLAGLGAGLGILFAWWGAPALVAARPTFSGALLDLDVSPDWRVLGFTSAVALLTGVIFGLVPALRATRLDLTKEFQGGTRLLGAGSRSPLARTAIVAQVVLSLVLLVTAGLFVRTLGKLQQVDIGFNRQGLMLFQLNAPAAGANSAAAQTTYLRVRERLEQVPGVREATFAHVASLSQNTMSFSIMVPGVAMTGDNDSIDVNGIAPEYFQTLEIPLLSGRDFLAGDVATAPKVAIVNQAFARKYFGGENPIGRRIRLNGSGNEPNTEIVGLVRDARYADLKTAQSAVVYLPYAQMGTPGAGHFAVRFAGDPATIVPALRAAVREIDAGLPLFNLRTQEQQIERLVAQEKLFAGLCGVFSLLALALSAVGLYGLMSYTVARRTGEMGLRMALGALPAQVFCLIAGEAFRLVALGAAIGLAASVAATRLISSVLFGVTPLDPLTYVAGVALLAAVVLGASLLPARRATRVDPITALRSD